MPIKWPWQKKSVTDTLQLFREILGGASSRTGASVTAKTALELSTSLACARVISEGIAQIPLKIFREGPDGRKDPAKDHPSFEVLHRKPNALQTSYEMREQMGLHLVLCGNFFALKIFNSGIVTELLPFTPGQITVKKIDDSTLEYLVRLDDGSTITIPQENMWHVRGPSWNGWQGLEGVALAREAIGLAMATEDHGSRLFSQGARMSGILTTDGPLTPEQITRLRKSWDETQGGDGGAHKPAILFGGLKFQPTQMQNDNSQFLETRKFQIEEICRVFRVLPVMVGHSDKASTYASVEQLILAHVVHTMGPWYERIEQSINANILTEKDRASGLYAKFIVNGLLRGSLDSKANFYTRLYGIGVLSPNEIRALEELNPYDGGDAYRVPLNMADPNAAPTDQQKPPSETMPNAPTAA